MMGPSSRVLLLISLVACGVGIVDGAIGGEWDLVAVFALVASLQVTLLARSTLHHVAVPLRPDLARWAEDRSERTGESVSDIVDRSMAWYQHGLYRSETRDG